MGTFDPATVRYKLITTNDFINLLHEETGFYKRDLRKVVKAMETVLVDSITEHVKTSDDILEINFMDGFCWRAILQKPFKRFNVVTKEFVLQEPRIHITLKLRKPLRDKLAEIRTKKCEETVDDE